MIDLISKLPEGSAGIALALVSWLGFNYAVLGERAMLREVAAPAKAACVEQLEAKEVSRIVPRSGIGELFGMPELDELEARLAAAALPPALGSAAIAARCACAVASSPDLRLDYAIHTATFRVVAADRAASFRTSVITAATSGRCVS